MFQGLIQASTRAPRTIASTAGPAFAHPRDARCRSRPNRLASIPRARTASKPGGEWRDDVPVDAHSRPLLDDRRPGGLRRLLRRSSLTIDRTASDAPLRLNPPPGRNTLMLPCGSDSGCVLSPPSCVRCRSTRQLTCIRMESCVPGVGGSDLYSLRSVDRATRRASFFTNLGVRRENIKS